MGITWREDWLSQVTTPERVSTEWLNKNILAAMPLFSVILTQ